MLPLFRVKASGSEICASHTLSHKARRRVRSRKRGLEARERHALRLTAAAVTETTLQNRNRTEMIVHKQSGYSHASLATWWAKNGQWVLFFAPSPCAHSGHDCRRKHRLGSLPSVPAQGEGKPQRNKSANQPDEELTRDAHFWASPSR